MARYPSQSEEFRQVYDTYVGPMRDYCFRRLPASDANDALAEVFVAVWRKIEDMPDEPERKLWLYGVARNSVRNTLRSFRRRVRLNGKVSGLRPEVSPGPEAVIVRHYEQEALLSALAELRPMDQEVLRLRAWEELSAAEIAEVMDLSVRAVETRLSRARQKLARKAVISQPADAASRPSPVEQGGER
ncbi:MAG: sigma-70 family RNA polymerase sigma factor [Acidimicrobiia bacterium]|nr:sigma-70 family RNA polymerase sigma factor [Acidimicrobiia bacterium]